MFLTLCVFFLNVVSGSHSVQVGCRVELLHAREGFRRHQQHLAFTDAGHSGGCVRQARRHGNTSQISSYRRVLLWHFWFDCPGCVGRSLMTWSQESVLMHYILHLSLREVHCQTIIHLTECYRRDSTTETELIVQHQCDISLMLLWLQKSTAWNQKSGGCSRLTFLLKFTYGWHFQGSIYSYMYIYSVLFVNIFPLFQYEVLKLFS